MPCSQRQGMTHSEPLPLTLTFYLSICLLSCLWSFLTSLPALFLFDFFFFFPFSHFLDSCKDMLALHLSHSQKQWNSSLCLPALRLLSEGSSVWNEMREMCKPWLGFMFTQRFLGFVTTGTPIGVAWLKQRDMVHSQSTLARKTPVFRV